MRSLESVYLLRHLSHRKCFDLAGFVIFGYLWRVGFTLRCGFCVYPACLAYFYVVSLVL